VSKSFHVLSQHQAYEGEENTLVIASVRPELVEGLPMLRQAQHERHNDMGKLFFGRCQTFGQVLMSLSRISPGGVYPLKKIENPLTFLGRSC
jgi:hypothetical protein